MKDLVYFLLVLDALVVAVVLLYLLAQARQLLSFAKDLKGLPPTNLGTEPAPFSGKSELPRLGNQFINAFRTADANNSLSQFDVERQLTPIGLRLRDKVSRYVAGRTGFVFYDYALAYRARQLICNNAGSDIHCPAWCKTNKQPDGPDRVALCRHIN